MIGKKKSEIRHNVQPAEGNCSRYPQMAYHASICASRRQFGRFRRFNSKLCLFVKGLPRFGWRQPMRRPKQQTHAQSPFKLDHRL